MLLVAHVVYCVPRMRWPVVFTLNARLQHDTHNGIEQKAGGSIELVCSKEPHRVVCYVYCASVVAARVVPAK